MSKSPQPMVRRPDLVTTVHQASATMDALQRKLLKAGLAATARKVNIAVQRLGYEAAELMEKRKRNAVR